MRRNTHSKKAFTLVEILVVVGIIGFLNALAFPALAELREAVVARRLAHDFKTIANSIEIAITELGYYPRDGFPNRHPRDLDPYLPKIAKSRSSVITNASWDWENWAGQNRFCEYGITLRCNSADNRDLAIRIDKILDDGDLSTGYFQNAGGGFTLIIGK